MRFDTKSGPFQAARSESFEMDRRQNMNGGLNSGFSFKSIGRRLPRISGGREALSSMPICKEMDPTTPTAKGIYVRDFLNR